MRLAALAASILTIACAPCGKTLDPRPMPCLVATPANTPVPAPTPDDREIEISKLKDDVEYYRDKWINQCD